MVCSGSKDVSIAYLTIDFVGCAENCVGRMCASHQVTAILLAVDVSPWPENTQRSLVHAFHCYTHYSIVGYIRIQTFIHSRTPVRVDPAHYVTAILFQSNTRSNNSKYDAGRFDLKVFVKLTKTFGSKCPGSYS